MAIKDKNQDRKDQLLANPIADRVTPVTPKQRTSAQSESQQKGNTTTRTVDAASQRFLNGLIVPPQAQQDSVEESQTTRLMRLLMISNALDMTRQNLEDTTPDPVLTQIYASIDKAYDEFHQTNSSDREQTAEYERSITSVPSTSPLYRPHFSVRDDGFKPPKYTLDPSAARAQLANDIMTVSNMYSADAGMSPRDFARVMGGVATIESKFGVLRSVSGTKYESSAGGAFHYLNATIAGKVNQGMSDMRIANRVAGLNVNIQDGVTKSEAWTLKEDNVLAGSVLARDIVKIVKANPELRNDIAALTTRVYQEHNMGEAGAAALARGGVSALNALDSRIAANNPMFFRSGDAQQNYKNFVSNAVNAADNLFHKLQAPVVAAGPRAPEPS